MKTFKFIGNTAIVLIQQKDNDIDNAWEMLEELIDKDRFDEFILDNNDSDVQTIKM